MVRSKTQEKPITNPEKDPETFSQGITAIAVKGYKALSDDCRIEVRPLTILSGANSSGKSSIMQPLLLMKQTLEASYDPGSLLLDGPNLRFTSADQFFSSGSSKKESGFKAEIELNKARSLITIFQKSDRNPIKISEMQYLEKNGLNIKFKPDLSHDEIFSLLPENLQNFYRKIVSPSKHSKKSNNSTEPLEENNELQVFQSRCFFEIGVLPSRDSDDVFVFQGFSSPATEWEHRIREVIHVPGLRGNSERSYKATAVGSTFPGTFESYVASVVRAWDVDKDDQLKKLGEWLRKLGLTHKITTEQVNDTQVELRVDRLPHRTSRSRKSDMVSIADVGFGVSHVLPALVALLTAKVGQLVYIEQPEIHLHPRAQVSLAEILVETANRGVRVVAETHSELLLVAIQSLIAEGKISSDLVKLHWFTRNKDGMTQITSADLDEAGAFGDWPEDFAEVAMDLDDRYLTAAEAKLWNNQSNGNQN
jgi:predicted ATPase